MYMAGKLTVSSMICWKQTRRKRRGTRTFLPHRAGGCYLVHCPHQCLWLPFKALLEAGLGTRSSSSNGSWAARSATAVSISCLSLMRSWTSSSGAGAAVPPDTASCQAPRSEESSSARQPSVSQCVQLPPLGTQRLQYSALLCVAERHELEQRIRPREQL